MTSLEELLKHSGHNPCIVEDSITRSYGEILEAVRATRNVLGEKGISSQSVVALTTYREASSVIALLSLLEMGCSVLLTYSGWPQSMHEDAVQRVAASHIVTGQSLNQIVVQPTSSTLHKPSWAQGAAVIVATSGSTGVPKLALLSLSSLLMSARTSASACALTSQDCWHLSLPLFHVGGLGVLFRTLVMGSRLSLTHSFNGNAELEPTHISVVPTQLYRLLRDSATREALRRKKAVMVGGAPIGERLLLEALDLDVPIMTTYGLTEMGSAVTIASSQLISEGQAVSLGSPLPGRELKLSPNGEVLTRGETLFQGYITAEGLSLPLLEGGWFPTGDIGHILSDGTLAIHGRRDAQFISGGENIHPEMIENALTSLPQIIAACVVPIADEEFGHRPFAFVISERTTLDRDEIRESLRSMIPAFALPIAIKEAPRDLLTSNGKISRQNALRAAVGRTSF